MSRWLVAWAFGLVCLLVLCWAVPPTGTQPPHVVQHSLFQHKWFQRYSLKLMLIGLASFAIPAVIIPLFQLLRKVSSGVAGSIDSGSTKYGWKVISSAATAGTAAHGPSKRSESAVAALGDLVYIFGGRDSSNNELADMYAFNLDNEQWSTLTVSSEAGSVAPSARRSAKMIGCPAGQCLVMVGGVRGANDLTLCDDSFWFDVKKRVWKLVDGVKDSIGARLNFGMAETAGSIFVFGGRTADGQGKNDIFQLSCVGTTSTPQWRSVCPMNGLPPSPRYAMGMAAYDRVLYIFGGLGTNARRALNDLHEFNTQTLSWRALDTALVGVPPAPRLRSTLIVKRVSTSRRPSEAATSSTSNQPKSSVKLFVVGGNSPAGEILQDVHRYTVGLGWVAPEDDILAAEKASWRGAARHGAGMTEWNGYVLMFGGETADGKLAPIELVKLMLQ